MLETAIVLLVLLIIGRTVYLRMQPSHSTGSAPSLSKMPKDAQSAFIVCTFSILRKLAEVDGRVDREESKRVKRYIYDDLKLSPREAKLALKVYQEAADSPLEMNDYADRFAKTYPDRVQVLDRMVRILLEVSLADGRVSSDEEEAIRSVALRLGLSLPGFERIKSELCGPSKMVH